MQQKDTIQNVTQMQVAGSYLLGTLDSTENGEPVSYFLLNTSSGAFEIFSDEKQLDSSASDIGVQVKLAPVYDVYWSNRITWFDRFVVAILVLPPLVYAGLLLRWLLGVRKSYKLQPTGRVPSVMGLVQRFAAQISKGRYPSQVDEAQV